ncbi:hypothetical protein RAR94_09975 [Vibrio vulnificus]
MSKFSDYYVVYQRVGEHAMVLTGHEKNAGADLTFNQFQENTNRWFYFENGFRDEDTSQGIHHQLYTPRTALLYINPLKKSWRNTNLSTVALPELKNIKKIWALALNTTPMGI